MGIPSASSVSRPLLDSRMARVATTAALSPINLNLAKVPNLLRVVDKVQLVLALSCTDPDVAVSP